MWPFPYYFSEWQGYGSIPPCGLDITVQVPVCKGPSLSEDHSLKLYHTAHSPTNRAEMITYSTQSLRVGLLQDWSPSQPKQSTGQFPLPARQLPVHDDTWALLPHMALALLNSWVPIKLQITHHAASIQAHPSISFQHIDQFHGGQTLFFNCFCTTFQCHNGTYTIVRLLPPIMLASPPAFWQPRNHFSVGQLLWHGTAAVCIL